MRKILQKPWTAEDDALLIALLERGASRVLMAAKLRRTMSAIYHRALVLRKEPENDIAIAETTTST